MAEARNGTPGVRLQSPTGLRAEFNDNGSLRRLDAGAVTLSLFVGNEIEGGPANLYLRRRAPSAGWTALLGPRSPTRMAFVAADRCTGSGRWHDIEYTLTMRLAAEAPAWFWHLRLTNRGSVTVELDLTYAQDLGLAPYGAVRMNEYYVSQYVDHTALQDPERGYVLASRQNQAVDGCYPWSLLGSLRRAVSYATDALQFHGFAARSGDVPPGLAAQLPGRRLQHEHSMIILRDAPLRLAPGEAQAAGFFGSFLSDHPAATAPTDLARVPSILALAAANRNDAHLLPDAAGAGQPAGEWRGSDGASLFTTAPLLAATELADEVLERCFPRPWRHEERDGQGALLSLFHAADRHVVLAAKERQVLRPHGHILRSGCHLTPDESGLTSTVWMNGVFHSLLTQGHVSINRIFSTSRSYLGLLQSHGVRVFVEIAQRWHLLQMPSAFEMAPEECRWIYQSSQADIVISARASGDPHQMSLSIEVARGAAARFLISHHVALYDDDGSRAVPVRWSCAANVVTLVTEPETDLGRRFPAGRFSIELNDAALDRAGGDELLFEDGRSRSQPYLCLRTQPTRRASLRYLGHLVPEVPERPLRVKAAEDLKPELVLIPPRQSALGESVSRLAELLPWLAHNAFVHYLSPRGLEQYSGGGWGTRDVCQGPVELLLALEQRAPVRDLLLRVLAMQNPDGDWPQWFMFFDRERGIRAGDSHGDIVFWPLLVLAQYLTASADSALLDERLPFFDARGPRSGETGSVWDHVQRALGVIGRRVIPGTALAAYGHGDWNDALQPADPRLRERLCSAWTVTLHYQTLTQLARALLAAGRAEDAARLEATAAQVLRDFRRVLLPSDVLAGYALFEADGSVRHLLHPSDERTGVRYSSLAMIHAILEDMLTPAQARDHVRIIETHLSGPDGLRLFDRPLAYQGGPQRLFQRAESASYFGREIGLMYVHAHLRYAQALAHMGEAGRFFRALMQATPIGIREVVPSASPRQSNCYYSSSDAAFADRYEASTHYERVASGEVPLEGGWRVYSSGAGISVALILRRLLGFTLESDALCIDPVMPAALDGLRARIRLAGRRVEVTYRIGPHGHGVQSVQLNGQSVGYRRDPNPHRPGAARLALAEFGARLSGAGDRIVIQTG